MTRRRVVVEAEAQAPHEGDKLQARGGVAWTVGSGVGGGRGVRS